MIFIFDTKKTQKKLTFCPIEIEWPIEIQRFIIFSNLEVGSFGPLKTDVKIDAFEQVWWVNF